MKDLRVYDLVVLTHKADATVWRVLDIDGFNIRVVDANYPQSADQIIDKSLLQRLTQAQLLDYLED